MDERRAAVRLIINRELGLNFTENLWRGSYIINELAEFERISERGGVLGAMDTMYQRGKIQDEFLHYERLKHDGARFFDNETGASNADQDR